MAPRVLQGCSSQQRRGCLPCSMWCSPAQYSQPNSNMLQEAASTQRSLAAAEEHKEELQSRCSDLQAQLAGSEAQHQALYGEHTALQV